MRIGIGSTYHDGGRSVGRVVEEQRTICERNAARIVHGYIVEVSQFESAAIAETYGVSEIACIVELKFLQAIVETHQLVRIDNRTDDVAFAISQLRAIVFESEISRSRGAASKCRVGTNGASGYVSRDVEFEALRGIVFEIFAQELAACFARR